jgi:Helicase associated domain
MEQPSLGRLSNVQVERLNQIGFVWRQKQEENDEEALLLQNRRTKSKKARGEELAQGGTRFRPDNKSPTDIDSNNATTTIIAPSPENKRKRNNTKCRSWDESFKLLLAWQKQHGHLQVPVSDPSVGRWFHNQRASYWRKRRGKGHLHRRRISEEQIKRLEEIGMTWHTPHRSVHTDDDQQDDTDEMDGTTTHETASSKKRICHSSSAEGKKAVPAPLPESTCDIAFSRRTSASAFSKSTQLGPTKPTQLSGKFAADSTLHGADDDDDDNNNDDDEYEYDSQNQHKPKHQRIFKDSRQQHQQQCPNSSFLDRKERLKHYLCKVPNVTGESEQLELTTTTAGFTESELESLVQDAAMVPRRAYVLAARHRRLQLQETGGRLPVPEQQDVNPKECYMRPVGMPDFEEIFGEKVKSVV